MENSHTVRLPSYAEEFRRCLVDCDIDGIKALWAHVAPTMPQTKDDKEVLVAIHMTRTQTERLPFRFRAYSHAWLTERSLPSQLPDHMKPRADRMYPRVVSAVGICVAGFGNIKTDYHHWVSKKLCEVVENFYADGIEDPVPIKARMKEVHDLCRKQK